MSSAVQTGLGSVVSLWRYPVKSMMGEELNASEVTERGFASRFDAFERFRPNIVVQPASGEKSFAENDWIGHTLAIGPDVRLDITRPCGRCVMTTLAQGDLSKDPGILRTAAQHTKLMSACMLP